MADEKGGKTARLVGLTALTSAFAHPLAYVKVLVQVGYEPVAPKRGKTFFGQDILYLPGFFDYAAHIKQTDGISGLYRGLVPRVLHNIVIATVTNTVNSNFQTQNAVEDSVSKLVGEADESEEPKPTKNPKEFLIETCQLSIGKAAGVIISYPFHLISIRTMVQFVGKETHYNNLFSSITEIYREEGVLGFFSGLVPQLLGEMLSFWIFRTLSYVIDTHLIGNQGGQNSALYVQGISQYISSLVTFPFYVVTNVMAINNTRLAAGNPPNMPVFTNWIDCWMHLKREKILRRGDSILRRTAAIKSL